MSSKIARFTLEIKKGARSQKKGALLKKKVADLKSETPGKLHYLANRAVIREHVETTKRKWKSNPATLMEKINKEERTSQAEGRDKQEPSKEGIVSRLHKSSG